MVADHKRAWDQAGVSPQRLVWSSAEMLRVSKTGLLLPEKSDGGEEVPVRQLGARSGNPDQPFYLFVVIFLPSSTAAFARAMTSGGLA